MVRTTPRSQKAPSAIRCIKTEWTADDTETTVDGQKAPSAIRCIKTDSDVPVDDEVLESEST